MRKTFVWLAATVISGSVWADVCSDLSTQYASLLTRLQQETQAALSQTTDPAEQDAIRASFEAQKASLEAERDSTLAASGCLAPTTPPPDPGTGTGGTGTTDPGTGTTGPGTGGTDPGTGTTDPGTGPTTGGGDDQSCKDLKDQVRTEAKAREATGGRKAAVAYINSRKAELKALCGGSGFGQCHRKDDKGTKCERDEHEKKCDKPEPRNEEPKCEPKRTSKHKKFDR